ncbi:MAG: hypothetical protein FIB04_14070, partial [Gammaproteobacteria bacterium]|nr:hypothetical protein [Gammaproteobacteria bacterium]
MRRPHDRHRGRLRRSTFDHDTIRYSLEVERADLRRRRWRLAGGRRFAHRLEATFRRACGLGYSLADGLRHRGALASSAFRTLLLAERFATITTTAAASAPRPAAAALAAFAFGALRLIGPLAFDRLADRIRARRLRRLLVLARLIATRRLLRLLRLALLSLGPTFALAALRLLLVASAALVPALTTLVGPLLLSLGPPLAFRTSLSVPALAALLVPTALVAATLALRIASAASLVSIPSAAAVPVPVPAALASAIRTDLRRRGHG